MTPMFTSERISVCMQAQALFYYELRYVHKQGAHLALLVEENRCYLPANIMSSKYYWSCSRAAILLLVPQIVQPSSQIRKTGGQMTLCELELYGYPAFECKCDNGTPVPGWYCSTSGEDACMSCEDGYRVSQYGKCESRPVGYIVIGFIVVALVCLYFANYIYVNFVDTGPPADDYGEGPKE